MKTLIVLNEILCGVPDALIYFLIISVGSVMLLFLFMIFHIIWMFFLEPIWEWFEKKRKKKKNPPKTPEESSIYLNER